MKIKGFYKKLPTPKTPLEIVDSKLNALDEKVDSKIDEVKQEVKSISEELKKKEYITTELKGKDGRDGKDADEEKIVSKILSEVRQIKKGDKGDKGQDAESIDEKKIIDEISSRIPDENTLINKVISQIPKNEETIKVIRETVASDPMSVIEKIMSLPEGKFKLKLGNIDGLNQTIQAFRSQLSRGYLHGGGDTVVAGTGISITTNPNGSKTITNTGVVVDTDKVKVSAVDTTANYLKSKLLAGTGISLIDSGAGNETLTIVNSAPDQIVSLTPGTNITSITGTYPNFTINAATQTTDLSGQLHLDQTVSQTIINGQPIWNTLTVSKVVFTDASKKFTSTGIGTSSQFIKGDGSLDSSIYLTSNQTITLGGILSGSGTTSITASAASGYYMPTTTDQSNWNGKFTLPTLTAGSVLYSNGSTISQDNANFFWDATNHRLGLGTITPNAKLDILTTSTQLRLSYDTTNYTTFDVYSDGHMRIWNHPTNSSASYLEIGANLMVGGAQMSAGYIYPSLSQDINILGSTGGGAKLKFGLGTPASNTIYGNLDGATGNWRFGDSTAGSAKVHIVNTTEQLRVGYSDSVYQSFVVNSVGTLGVTANGVTAGYVPFAFYGVPFTYVDARVNFSVTDTSTMAAGVGGGMSLGFKVNSGGTLAEAAAGIKVSKANATDNDLTSSLIFWNRKSGDPTERMRIDPTGNVGIGTTSPTNILSFGGDSARTLWMERHTTANTAGNSLTIQAGGATVGATDKNGGILYETPGISTGTGIASIRLQSLSRSASTGTSDNTVQDRVIIPSELNLTDNGVISLFEVALPAGTATAGSIDYGVIASDGTDFDVHQGHAQYGAINKGGVYTTSIVDETATDQVNIKSHGGVAMTESWTILTGTNKITIQAQFNSSLASVTSMKLRYTIKNNSSQTITQL